MMLLLRLPIWILLASSHWFTSVSIKTNNPGTLCSPDAEDPIPEESMLTVHAEPKNSTITVQFILNEESSIHLVLFNLIGQGVATWEWENMHPGVYDLKLINLDLNSGIYFLSFHSVSLHLTKKVLYVR